MTEQRWLSLTGICTTLQMTEWNIKTLVKQGVLVKIGTSKDTRYLDPTPEYAEKLKLGEALYGRLYPIPFDLSTTALISTRELAEILGWKLKYARQYVWREDVPHIRVGLYDLYTVATVRDLLWKRQGRKFAGRRSPFLIPQLIDFFMRQLARENEEVPTDEQFAQDDLIERKLVRMSKLKSPDKEAAFADFYRKVELSRQVAAAMTPEVRLSGKSASLSRSHQSIASM